MVMVVPPPEDAELPFPGPVATDIQNQPVNPPLIGDKDYQAPFFYPLLQNGSFYRGESLSRIHTNRE